LNESKENIKRILANAYLEQRSPSDDIRLRRQANQSNNIPAVSFQSKANPRF